MTYHKYTKELLEPFIKQSFTWANVCRLLGIQPATGSQTHLKKRAVAFEIDFSHFIGKASNKGKKFPKKNLDYYFSNQGSAKSHWLKLRMVAEGIKEAKCEKCYLSIWLGEELPLHLDHINGDHQDNTLSNLMILCPNCHAVKTRRQALNRRGSLAQQVEASDLGSD